jgi:hypothetical protein
MKLAKKIHLLGVKQYTTLVSGGGLAYGLVALGTPLLGGVPIGIGASAVSIAVGAAAIIPFRKTNVLAAEPEIIKAKAIVPDNEAKRDNTKLTQNINKIKVQTASAKYTLPASAQTELDKIHAKALEIITQEDLNNVETRLRMTLESMFSSYIPESISYFSQLTPKDRMEGTPGAVQLKDQFERMLKAINKVEKEIYDSKIEKFEVHSRFVQDRFADYDEESKANSSESPVASFPRIPNAAETEALTLAKLEERDRQRELQLAGNRRKPAAAVAQPKKRRWFS